MINLPASRSMRTVASSCGQCAATRENHRAARHRRARFTPYVKGKARGCQRFYWVRKLAGAVWGALVRAQNPRRPQKHYRDRYRGHRWRCSKAISNGGDAFRTNKIITCICLHRVVDTKLVVFTARSFTSGVLPADRRILFFNIFFIQLKCIKYI
jgi:hypothetical protein